MIYIYIFMSHFTFSEYFEMFFNITEQACYIPVSTRQDCCDYYSSQYVELKPGIAVGSQTLINSQIKMMASQRRG